MTLDPRAPIPLYFQLKTLLVEEILSGRYRPDDRLPTEYELCERYGISRTPVHRAMSELADEGVILRRRRRGTFINPHWLRRRPDRAELRVMIPDGPWETQVRAAVPADTRVNIATAPLPDLYRILTRSVAEGTAPDLAVLDSVWVSEFAADGFLWPLDELDPSWMDHDYRSDFLEPFVSANRLEGKAYAVQAEADVAGLWYRREVLDWAAASSATWEDLLAATRNLAEDAARHVLVMPGGSKGGETTTYCLLALLAANNAAVLVDEGVVLDSRETVQTLRFLRSLIDEGLMPPDVVAFEWDRPIRLLASGQAAASVGGSYEARMLSEAAGLPLEKLWDTFGFISLPSSTNRSATLAGGMVYGIFRQAAHPKQAMRLLEHLVTPAALAEMSRSTGQIPPRRSAVDLVAPGHPFLATTAAMLEQAIVRPVTPAYARVSAQLRTMVEAVLTGRLGPAAATERTAELLGAITGLPVLHDMDIYHASMTKIGDGEAAHRRPTTTCPHSTHPVRTSRWTSARGL